MSRTVPTLIVLGVALLSLWMLGCEAFGFAESCTAAGCNNRITLAMVDSTGQPLQRFEGGVDIAGAVFFFDCSDGGGSGYDTLSHYRWTCGSSTVEFSGLRDDPIREIAIEVTAIDKDEAISRSLTLALDRYLASGDCGPECWHGTGTLHLETSE